MPAFEKLARNLVAEIPVTIIKVVFEDHPKITPFSGGICGNGCSGGEGHVCGMNCPPAARAGVVGVIDPEGRLGLTAKDISDIHDHLPKLRLAVVRQIEENVSQLRGQAGN